FAIARRQAGEADQLPRHFVFVAAIDRIGKEAFHGELQEIVEEECGGESRVELRLAGVHGGERFLALCGREAVEFFAVSFLRPLIRRGDPGAEKFARTERELISELRFCRQKWSLAIEPRAIAEP